MAKATQGFEFAYSLDATKPWIESVPTTASVTYKKGDLVYLSSGRAALGTAAMVQQVIGVIAEAATVNSSTVPGTVACARITPAHVFRVQYTGTPDAGAIRGGTIDLENEGTVDASDVTVVSGNGLVLDKGLDTTNQWAYVRVKNIYGFGN